MSLSSSVNSPEPDASVDSNAAETSSASQSHPWMEWTQQLEAYVIWLNSQLKKKEGTRQVEDLRNDLKDGVALVDLVEIVAGEKLAGVHACPSTMAEMRENVENVIHFMLSSKVKMHHISARDVVDGNLKSIMRLILALAAHFKPRSVRQSTYTRSPAKGGNSITSIAQGASAVLANARRDVARAGSQRYRHSAGPELSRRSYPYSSSDPASDSDTSITGNSSEQLSMYRMTRSTHERREVEGASIHRDRSPALRHSPHGEIEMLRSKSVDIMSDSHRLSSVGSDICDGSIILDPADHEILVKEHDECTDQMKTIKAELFKLQDLLLTGEPPDGAEDPHPLDDDIYPIEQLVILRSKLQQSDMFCIDLKDELSKTKNECLHLQGAKTGLQQRLTETEEAMLHVKAEAMKRSLDINSIVSERDEYRKMVQDKDKVMGEMRRELLHRDRKLEDLQRELKSQIEEKESISKRLNMQVQELRDRLRVVGEQEASLSVRVATQDKKMARLEGKIFQSQAETAVNRNQIIQNYPSSVDELQVVRDSLQSLRLTFKPSDAHHHTLDTLEQSIAALVEKLHLANGQLPRNQQTSLFEGVSRRLNFDSTGDIRRAPLNAIPGFPINRLDSMNGDHFTKVLYFTDKALTPFMCSLDKRLGEICLRDIKQLIDRPGSFRYHFKALDPEFGTVKEEIVDDGQVIPGWEGKIVAWIEEDTDQ